MKVLIEINCDNSTFGDYPGIELSRILLSLSYKLENYNLKDCEQSLFDVNGNKVGELKVEK